MMATSLTTTGAATDNVCECTFLGDDGAGCGCGTLESRGDERGDLDGDGGGERPYF
jgi:hypothetical protein